MPTLTISEGLGNTLRNLDTLLTRYFDALASGDAAVTGQNATVTVGFATLTFTGTGFSDVDGFSAETISGFVADFDFSVGGSGYRLTLDALDLPYADIQAVIEAEQTDPAAVEDWIGAMDWRIVANSASDDIWLDFETSDGVNLRFNGDDYIVLGDGANRFFGASGRDTIIGGAFDDTIHGGTFNDVLRGNDRHDEIRGGDGRDMIWGGRGNDVIYGGDGPDRIRGGIGHDTVHGGDGNDIIYGGYQSDTITGGAGDDWIRNFSGDSFITGGAGSDTIASQGGDARIFGGTGQDDIRSGGGDDTLFGNAGHDTLSASAGTNLLFGGSGNDTFVFHDRGNSTDQIADFLPGQDRILIADFDPADDTLTVSYTDDGALIELGSGTTILVSRVTETGPRAFTGFEQTDEGFILF